MGPQLGTPEERTRSGDKKKMATTGTWNVCRWATVVIH